MSQTRSRFLFVCDFDFTRLLLSQPICFDSDAAPGNSVQHRVHVVLDDEVKLR